MSRYDPKLTELVRRIGEAAKQVEGEIAQQRRKRNMHKWEWRRMVYLTETGRQEANR